MSHIWPSASELEFATCATWLHKAKEMPKAEFKREVTKHLTGRDEEPWELLYFKVYKTQLAVIEQALENASLLLGGQKSRGYCLEMICADFLAEANLEDPNPSTLLNLIRRFFELLPAGEKQELLKIMRQCA